MLTYFQREFLKQELTKETITAYINLNKEYQDIQNSINIKSGERLTHTQP